MNNSNNSALVSSALVQLLSSGITYPLHRRRLIQQAGLQSSALENSSSSSFASLILNGFDDNLMKIITSLFTSDTSMSDWENLFHGFPLFFCEKLSLSIMSNILTNVVNDQKLSIRDKRIGISFLLVFVEKMSRVLSNRMACDLNNEMSAWDQLSKFRESHPFGIFGIATIGFIPETISHQVQSVFVPKKQNFLSKWKANEDSSLNQKVWGIIRNSLYDLLVGVVKYPYSTVSLRMHLDPERNSREIFNEINGKEGWKGFYSGFLSFTISTIISNIISGIFNPSHN